MNMIINKSVCARTWGKGSKITKSERTYVMDDSYGKLLLLLEKFFELYFDKIDCWLKRSDVFSCMKKRGITKAAISCLG